MHKLKFVRKELNETKVWLRMIALKDMVELKTTSDAVEENGQLSLIITSSIMTATKCKAKESPPK